MSTTEKEHPFKIKYKGYTVTQNEGHLMITDINRKMVFHAQGNTPRTAAEMREAVDFYLDLIESEAEK